MFLSLACFKSSQDIVALLTTPLISQKSQYIRSLLLANEGMVLNRDMIRVIIDGCLSPGKLGESFLFMELLFFLVGRNDLVILLIIDINYMDKILSLFSYLARSIHSADMAKHETVAQFEQSFIYAVRLVELIFESKMGKKYFLSYLGSLISTFNMNPLEKMMHYFLANKERLKFLEPFYFGQASPSRAKNLDEAFDVILKVIRDSLEEINLESYVTPLYVQISNMIIYFFQKKGIVSSPGSAPYRIEDGSQMITTVRIIVFKIYPEESFPIGNNFSLEFPVSLKYPEFYAQLELTLPNLTKTELYYKSIDGDFWKIFDNGSFYKMIVEAIKTANQLESSLVVKLMIKPIEMGFLIRYCAMLRLRKCI
jgi:hypothetical protein